MYSTRGGAGRAECRRHGASHLYFSGIEAGMRRHTVGDHLELPDPLPAGLEGTAGQRRLEHEDRLALPCLGLDERARGRAAGFFVGGPQHHDARLVQRLAGQERARGQRGEANAGLHVEDAGAMEPPLHADERHRRQLADGPHRVEVPEQEDLVDATAELRLKMIAARVTRVASDPRTKRRELPLELQAAPVYRGLVVGRRFAGDQRRDQAQHPLPLGLAELEDPRHRIGPIPGCCHVWNPGRLAGALRTHPALPDL